jgi:prolipoprotein diacylglyceryltransferase
MFKILLALHLLFAIFAIGPLVHAATTAGRGVRTGDGAATASSARVLKIYSYGSLLVVIFGFGLMSAKRHGQKVAEFSEPWVWISALLWLVAVALVLAFVVPALERATDLITKQESVVSLTGGVAAAGGVVGVIFAVIVFLMVYQPGH